MTRNNRLAAVALAAGVLLCAAPSGARAQAFPVVGPRALGMGGAFSAIADDASAVFWNPAGLAQLEKEEMLVFGGKLEETSGRLEERLANARDRDPKSESVYLDANESAALVEDLHSLLSDEVYATAGQQLGIVLASRRLGITLQEYRVQGARPVVDLSHVDAGSPESPTSISQNATQLSVSGVDRREIMLTGALFQPRAKLMGGVNLRYIQIKSYQDRPSIWDLSSSNPNDYLDQVRDRETADDKGWAADVGLLFLIGKMRVGLVTRNANAPSFAYPGGTEITLERQLHMGLAWYNPKSYGFAIDYDFRENASIAEGIPERRGAIGIEKWFSDGSWAMRFGANANTAVSGTPLNIAAGFTFRGEVFEVDYGMSTDTDVQSISVLASVTMRIAPEKPGIDRRPVPGARR